MDAEKAALIKVLAKINFQKGRIERFPTHLFNVNKDAFENCVSRYMALKKDITSQLSEMDIVLSHNVIVPQTKEKITIVKPTIFKVPMEHGVQPAVTIKLYQTAENHVSSKIF